MKKNIHLFDRNFLSFLFFYKIKEEHQRRTKIKILNFTRIIYGKKSTKID